MASEVVYGAFHGGDPREFTPDPECSTEAERAAHKAACEAWDRGERPELPPSCEVTRDDSGRVVKMTHRQIFGLGTYTVDLEEYEPPEMSEVDMLAWFIFDVVDEFCDCGNRHTSLPSAHADTCLYPAKAEAIERLRGQK